MDYDDDYNVDCELENCVEDLKIEDLEDSNENEYSYEMLNPEKLVTYMLEKITSISKILEIPNTTTRILLHHFKWDEEKLLDKFYSEDRAALFQAAHIVDPAVVGKNSHKLSVDSTEECDICLSPLPRNMMTGLECEHRFCSDCWNEYLSVKVIGEGEGFTISCPAHKCDILVDDASAMALIKDSKVKTKYQFLITQSFVEYNRLLKWCPTPNCDQVIKVQYTDFKPVTCKCGLSYCLQCNEKWHAPISCEYLKKWLKRIEDDSATSTWIKLNTRDCPKCFVSIEKNGGCNQMTCKKCKYEFCWVCTQNWKRHGFNYNCNKFVDGTPGQKETSKLALRRFLFYSDRYRNHLKSHQLEKNLYEIINKKMLELQRMNMTWQDTRFLEVAVNALCQCRQTLMYSYAFAFYMYKSNQSTIFEDNQQDLEKATETLSHYLEQDITNEDLSAIKSKVQDKTYYCQSRRKVLLDHVREGHEKEWWSNIKIK